MNVSIGNQYKAINQIFELVFKLFGQYQLKENTNFLYKCIKWWKMCSTVQSDLLCRNCLDFLLWVIFGFCSEIVLVGCCNFLHCISILLKMTMKKKVINFSLSACNSTVIVPKIRECPVLVWQFLPFHCYF